MVAAGDLDIDLTTFDFPTDKLTIKSLRQIYRGRLDNRDQNPVEPFKEGSVYEKLHELIVCERMQAIFTYDQARGKFRDFGVYGEDLEEARKDLAELYVQYGLATGPAHAEELARSVERQALQQAERHGGKTR